jgi:hypothetical protein
MYLTSKQQYGLSAQIGPQCVERASAAISAFHEIAGVPTPCAHELCSTVREVARRTLVANQRPKEVASPEEVAQLINHHIRAGVPLRTRMHITCAALCFSGLLRYDDLSHVLVHEDLLRIRSDRAEIYLYRSKTDQYCEGAVVTIGRIGGRACPVHLLEELLAAGEYQRSPALRPCRGRSSQLEDAEDVGPLLRATNAAGTRLEQTAEPLPKTIAALPYTAFAASLKRLCAAAGVRDLGTHAFRRGGATTAVEEGADRMTVQKLGRWKSSQVFEFAYVRESAAHQAAVTGRLRLRLPAAAT